MSAWSDQFQRPKPMSVSIAGVELHVVDRYPSCSRLPYHIVTRKPTLADLLSIQTETQSWNDVGPYMFAARLFACSLDRGIDDGPDGLILEASVHHVRFMLRVLYDEGQANDTLVPFDSYHVDKIAREFAQTARGRQDIRIEVDRTFRAVRISFLSGPWLHRYHPQIAISPLDNDELSDDKAEDTIAELMKVSPEPVVSFRIARDYIRYFDRKSRSMELFDTRRAVMACLRMHDAIFDKSPGR